MDRFIYASLVKEKGSVAFSLSTLRNMMCVLYVLGSKEPPCWHRQEELYNSWDAEVHLHRRLFLGTVTLLSKLSCFGKKVFVLMF